jgi:outer membrane protein TolC
MVRAAGADVEAAAQDRSRARSGYLPRVDLVEEITRSNNPVFAFASKLGQERFTADDFGLESLNAPDPLTNSATRIVLKQNVWDAGRTLKYQDMAEEGVEAAAMSRERALDEVAFNAVRAFWDAVLAGEMLRVTVAAEEAAAANADLAAQQVEAGLAVPSDRMQAEVRLAEVRSMRIRAQEGVHVARAALREALGMKREEDFTLVPSEAEPEHPGEEAESAIAEALAGRSDLAALDRRLRQAALGEKVARSHWLPEVGVGAQYEWNSTELFGNDGTNWSIGALVRVPLFDGLETGARLGRARAEREALEARREAMAEGVRLQVRAAWAERSAAAQRRVAASSALGQAREALRIVRERYAEGLAVMVELLGAEAALTQAEGSLAAAEHDLAIAAASLDLARGRRPGGAAGGSHAS